MYKYYDAWFHIPGFNGYQINPYRQQIRSMKMMYKDPGHVLKPKSRNTDLDFIYELTADDGRRVRVRYSTLLSNTFENPEIKPQAVDENSTYLGARQKAFSKHHSGKPQKTFKLDLSKNVINNKNTD